MIHPTGTFLAAPRARVRRVLARRRGRYSNLGEQQIIEQYVRELGVAHRFAVDIAAGDGVRMSNTYALFKGGWAGLAVELSSVAFASLARSYRTLPSVGLARCKVTPDNVVALLEANQVPREFGVLSLDIDGYDYFVLEQILQRFRPSLICAEINEKIPPPVKFTVNWSDGYGWTGGAFYGQSLSQLHLLCPRFQYALVNVHYNNAFLVPCETHRFPALTPEQAYAEGYRDRPDRKALFPWNASMEGLLSMRPEEAVAFLNRLFADHKGQYTCTL